MPTREDLLADIREGVEAEHEIAAFEEACEAGYEGTLVEFRRDRSQKPVAPVVDEGLDEIPF